MKFYSRGWNSGSEIFITHEEVEQKMNFINQEQIEMVDTIIRLTRERDEAIERANDLEYAFAAAQRANIGLAETIKKLGVKCADLESRLCRLK